MKTIQARLDEESHAALRELVRRYGWTPSEAVREGLKEVARRNRAPRRKTKRFLGIGEFDSGIPDLGSNKRHLEGFGR